MNFNWMSIIDAIIPIITGVVSAWGGWFFARKKYNSEVDQNLINNMQDSLDFYIKISDDNKKRLDEVLKTNTELLLELNDLKNKVLNIALNICLNFNCANRIKESPENINKLLEKT